MLYLYNSLTKQKELFKPLVPQHISMYVCGVTVYDHCHLGHARCMVAFDMMTRYFRFLGYHVQFIRNITDVDDKIIKKALESQQDFDAVSQRFIESMHDDASSLGLKGPDVEPLATEHIEEMKQMIQTLIDKGFAYCAANGDVCFSVEKFKSYGKLSKQNIKQLLAGVRIDVADDKQSPIDFVLWKSSKPGEPAWSSPWGEGRPGWHIECSAMAKAHLGAQIDIHGGGLDLQFPHHENEIAQSEACNGVPFANYWLHVGLLQLNHEKMAKSTGNFMTIKDALKQYHPEVIKWFFMSAHYRSPLNYTEEMLQQAQKGLQRLYQTLKNFSSEANHSNVDETWLARFNQAMCDDFNTPEAIAIIFELNNLINKEKQGHLIPTLKKMAQLLGVLNDSAQAFLQFSSEESLSEQEILDWIHKRKTARLEKQYQVADEIRQYLLSHGVELEDTAQGTDWRRAGG
jgi:cysteinyl-tRNA synthetase